MSRKIFYYDDVCGAIDGYITNDDSDKIIMLIKKAKKNYKKGDLM